MATIKDVAKLAKVSVATVSRVVNRSPKTGQATVIKVNEAMQILGYRPNATARALVRQTTDTIGLVVNDVSDPFFGNLVKAVEQVISLEHKQLLIANGYHQEKKERESIELMIHSRCEAIIVHSKALADDELIAFAHEFPAFVLINRYIAALADRCIWLDNTEAALMATHYLIMQGHQQIAYLCSNHQIEDALSRRDGFIQALQQSNQLKNRLPIIFYGAPDEIGGEQATNELLDSYPNITAIATYNDTMAAGALSVLAERNIAVPQQIAVFGFDDNLIAKYLYPKLTTIHYPIRAMAQQAANLAIYLAKSKAFSRKQGGDFASNPLNNSDLNNSTLNSKDDKMIDDELITQLKFVAMLIKRDSA